MWATSSERPEPPQVLTHEPEDTIIRRLLRALTTRTSIFWIGFVVGSILWNLMFLLVAQAELYKAAL